MQGGCTPDFLDKFNSCFCLWGKRRWLFFLFIFLDCLRWEGWIGLSSARACDVEKCAAVFVRFSVGRDNEVQVRNSITVSVVHWVPPVATGIQRHGIAHMVVIS
jgi:hypothetical protein